MRILSNDFGQNHGFTLLDWESPEKYTLTSWEAHLGEEGHLDFQRKLDAVFRHNKTTIFLGERFLFLKEFSTRDKIDYTAAEYIGVAKLYCAQRAIDTHWQNASMACGKTAFWGDGGAGNDKIRKLGLWQTRSPHAMDSLRHMLYYVTFELNNYYFVDQLRG